MLPTPRLFRVAFPAVLALASLTVAWLPARACAARAEMSQGDIVVSVELPGRGLNVSCAGVELIKRSSLVVTTPPWAPHYYVSHMTEAQATIECRDVPAGQRLVIVHHGDRDAFVGTETLTLSPRGVLVQEFEAVFHESDGEALIQWCIGAFNPTVIAGRPFQATLANTETREGAVPLRATSRDLAACTLAQGFQSLRFDSRIGPVTIEVEAGRPLICYDFRSSRWADPRDPYFWFGDLDSRIRPDQPLRYRITYRLPVRAAEPTPPRRTRATARVTPAPHAQTTQTDTPPTIIPRPKSVTFTGVDAMLNNPNACPWRVDPALRATGDDRSAAVKQALDLLRADWRRMCETHHPPLTTQPARSSNPTTPQLRLTCAPADADLPAEGYTLAVAPERIDVTVADARGAEHASQTLRQLSSVTPDGAVRIAGCRIRDWPSLSFRGVHFFTGGRGNHLHLDLLDNVIAATKLNHVVLEAEYVNWDSHPEIRHPDYGMPKDQVRQFLAACRAHQIEVTPLVQSLGHCQWMFENGQNLELAEDPEARWAYCVTTPATYDFIFEIYTEALELFRPRYFHIGHDEFADRGRVPYRESSKPYTVQQLFMMDTLRLHAWFAERDIPMMMWGDMLLAHGEAPDACNAPSVEQAQNLREQLPDDVIINDWHYVTVDPSAYTSIEKFKISGQRVVAAGWYRPSNIVNLAQAAHDQRAWGYLQTTWAGYSLDDASFRRHRAQYAAWVLAAEAAWNAHHPPDPDTYRAGWHFLDLMDLSTLRPQNRNGHFVDLSAACNYPLAAGDDTGWFGLGPGNDLSVVSAGINRFAAGLAFHVPKPDKPAAIALHGLLAQDLALPHEVTVGLDLPAPATLAILHATNFAVAPQTPVGAYTVTYADGRSETIELIYGDNILAYNDLSAAPAAPAAWSGHTSNGEPIALRAFLWDLPHSVEPIRTLTLRTANAACSVLVLGVTALDAPPH